MAEFVDAVGSALVDSLFAEVSVGFLPVRSSSMSCLISPSSRSPGATFSLLLDDAFLFVPIELVINAYIVLDGGSKGEINIS